MFHFTSLKMTALTLLILLSLSACQPIRPERASTSTTCTDADKIALLQKYVDTYRNQDPQAGASLFRSDGKMGGTAGPEFDPATGKYTTYDVMFIGQSEILGILQFFVDIKLLNSIHDPVVQGDMVTAPGSVSTPFFLAHGIPATDLEEIFTIKVKDCQIAELHWEYTKQAIARLPAAAKALADECSDEYKLDLLQTYISGINEANSKLAALPYADDVHLEFEQIPILDQATQTYKSPPPSISDGLDQFKPVIDFFIDIHLNKTLDENSVTISGPTLAVSTTITSLSLKRSPWFLPVTQVNGKYIVTFDENCQIANLKFEQETGVEEKLNELKKNP